MELETTTLSCRKGPWNWKPWRFPAGKDHGIGNHDAFLQERIVAVKFIEFRPMQHVWFQTRFRERFRDGNSCKIANIFRRNPFASSPSRMWPTEHCHGAHHPVAQRQWNSGSEADVCGVLRANRSIMS